MRTTKCPNCEKVVEVEAITAMTEMMFECSLCGFVFSGLCEMREESQVNKLCKQCGGECCKYLTITVKPKNIDWMKTRGEVIEVNGKWIWRIPAVCRYLNKYGRCEIYDDRPEVCRVYPVDGENCKLIRKEVK